MNGFDYVAGFATIDITPPVGTPLAGFASRGFHTNSGAYHPLRASAMCLGDGSVDVLVISLEVLGTYEDLAEVIAGEVVRRTGLPRAAVLINSSHTHCGPALTEFDRSWHGWIDDGYRGELVKRIGDIAERALSYRMPVRVASATGECDFAMNRRMPSPDAPGRVVGGPHPEGLRDHDVPVVTLEAEDGSVRAVLFSYACHPTSRGGLRAGGDYVGFALDAVAAVFPDAQPIFLQGCAGDQKPRPSESAITGFGMHSIASVQALGEQLGAAVVAAVENSRPIAGRITADLDSVTLQSDPVTVEGIDEALRSSEVYLQRWAQRWQERLSNGEPDRSEIDLQLQVITIGRDLMIVAMGAEMTVEHGLRLKREYADRFAAVLPIGYSNTMIGYVPVARQFDKGGYEVLDANQYWGYSGAFVRETESRIHAQIASMVEQLG